MPRKVTMRHWTRIILGVIFLIIALSIFFERPRLNGVVQFDKIPLVQKLPSLSLPTAQNVEHKQTGDKDAEINSINTADDMNQKTKGDTAEDTRKEGIEKDYVDKEASMKYDYLRHEDLRLDQCFPEKYSETDYTMQNILDKVQYSGSKSYQYGKTTTNESIVEVIIVPQSHNDPGWLMPLEDYYKKKTVHILDNMVNYLTKYTTMTMIWPEVIFLAKWWNEASEDSRQKLRNLVRSGRLEIVSGGWVSPDEATCHYQAVLDQLIEGHQWLKQTLDIQPVNTWPLDQFGYSSSLPYIWQKAGMKNLGILRVTQNVKSYLAEKKLLNFLWRQAWDETGANDVLCHVEAYTWFVTTSSCGPSEYVCRELMFHLKNERMTIPKLSSLSEKLTEQFKMKASLYKHKVIIVPLGGDFAYDTVEEWRAQYNNVTALINYVNERKDHFGVTLRFGTVKDYFDRIKILQKDKKYETISGDFFTYAESHSHYWSGYFTTRPFDKRIGRVLMGHLRSAEILTSYSLATKCTDKDESVITLLKELEYARRTLALFQHHDAITGTSTRATASDYRTRLHIALVSTQRILSFQLSKLISTRPTDEIEVIPLEGQDHFLDQMRRKAITLNDVGKSVFVWNSLERQRKEIVCVLLNSTDSGISVTDSRRNKVQFQVNPVLSGGNDLSSKLREICFPVTVPAMGGVIYKLSKIEGRLPSSFTARIWRSWDSSTINNTWERLNVSKKLVFSNRYLTTYFDIERGLERICLVNTYSNDSCVKVTVDWSFYTAAADAYVFLPNGMPTSMKNLERQIYVVSGSLLSRVVLTTQLYQQVFTLYQSDGLQGQTLHMENNVSLVSASDNGKELLMNVASNLRTNKTFYTDANGLQMVRRTWRSGLPVGANFYPMTTTCFVEDHSIRLSVHSAQSLGVGSLYDGAMNILIDRKPTLSGKGLTEPVLDNQPTTSKFLIYVEDIRGPKPPSPSNTTSTMFSSLSSAIINDILQNPVLIFVINSSSTSVSNNIRFLDKDLPCELSLANFRNFIDGGAWNGSGLTLHRRPVPCRVTSPESRCALYENTVRLYELFTIKPQHIYKSSLTHFSTFKRIGNNDNITFRNMDLESYVIKWR